MTDQKERDDGLRGTLRFTSQPKSEKINFTLSHPTGYLDDEGKSQAGIEAGGEKRALFGKRADVKSAMAALPDGQRRYVGTFAWPSH